MFTDSINRAVTMAQIILGPATASGTSSTAVLRFGAPTYIGVEAPDIFPVVDTAADGTRVRPTRRGLYLAELVAPCGVAGTIQAGILDGPIANALTADPDPIGDNAAIIVTVAGVQTPYQGSRIIANLGNVVAPSVFEIAASVTNGAAGAPSDLDLATTVFRVSFIAALDPS